MRTITKASIATLAFAAIHSVLASRRVKQIAADAVGKECSEVTYRLFYVGQALLSFIALAVYCASLPKHTIYRIQGPGAWLFRAGQIAGVLHLLAGLQQIGPLRWAGLDKLMAWQQGVALPVGPVAQGPELADDGRLTTGGPFRWSRHPLNFSAVPIFWFTPHMTTRRLAFNLVGTAYMILGSRHEEARLRAVYGDAYLRYLESEVPFFWPSLQFEQERSSGSLESRRGRRDPAK